MSDSAQSQPTKLPAPKLDAHGRCPNCLIKPIPYRRAGKWFCHRCCRDYDMKTGEQCPSWAWKYANTGQWRPTSPDADYAHAKPSEATARAAARTEKCYSARIEMAQKLRAWKPWDYETDTAAVLMRQAAEIIESDDAAIAEIDRLFLVIESAVRRSDPPNHAVVLAALRSIRALGPRGKPATHNQP